MFVTLLKYLFLQFCTIIKMKLWPIIKILVVDDEEDLCEIFEIQFRGRRI